VTETVGNEVIAGVRDLLPTLRERAQETEDGRVIPAESIKALAETGFFRLLQPAAFGGIEADPLTFYTAVRLIASACGSTMAPGPVHTGGAAGGLGHRHRHQDLVLLRSDRQGGQGRRRAHGQRTVELLLRVRSRQLGLPRPDRDRRGEPAD
jgi:alkylation response protein AidB-like acyl-CoA dehydrogenase